MFKWPKEETMRGTEQVSYPVLLASLSISCWSFLTTTSLLSPPASHVGGRPGAFFGTKGFVVNSLSTVAEEDFHAASQGKYYPNIKEKLGENMRKDFKEK